MTKSGPVHEHYARAVLLGLLYRVRVPGTELLCRTVAHRPLQCVCKWKNG